MIKLAANLTLMFQEWPFTDRFQAARDAGFTAVEFSFPADIAPELIAERLTRMKLHQALATVPLRSGGKGLAAIAGQQAAFRDNFRLGLEYAAVAQSPLLHVLSGIVKRSDFAASVGQFLANMEWAIEQAEIANVQLVIEAINQHSLPGYFVSSLDNAFDWSQRLPGLGVILDLYHASMEGLNPIKCVRRYAPGCAHIQIAGHPGRNEPDRGSFSFSALASVISDSGYRGWVGAEYQPQSSTLEGLGWLKAVQSGMSESASGSVQRSNEAGHPFRRECSPHRGVR